ncbi:MAG: Rho termination factor N-terminal domain-containing protein [Thermoleophilaceae bacterium]
MRRLLLAALAALALVFVVAALRRQGADFVDGSVAVEPDLDAMTRDELYELAQQRGIAGRSRMKKGELRDALGRA